MQRKIKIVVLSADADETAALIRIIETGRYRTGACDSISTLEGLLRAETCLAVIIDVDNIALDNRTIRGLTRTFPSVFFLCLSRERFHPNLKEAISRYFFACLKKPVDPDELFYFLECIRDNEPETRAPPDV